ncbi:MAG: DUF2752 domain-containing protein [Gemmatales bacterium]|nr:DUF2752 domain-containing protein [Gemmatales bacterium]MDW8387961.1 DUF2752 domain-containing protein [Gemmatales bacterium]
MVPRPESNHERQQLSVLPNPRIGWWVRLTLLGVAVAIAGVFAVAAWLRPSSAGLGTHRQLGLPPCSFYIVTGGVPCPSCGMTTSFCHLVRGQILESLRANPVGTLLAGFCLLMLPYCTVCGVWGRRLFIRDYDVFLSRCVIIWVILMLGVWGIRLSIRWLTEGRLAQPIRTEAVSRVGGSESHDGQAVFPPAVGPAAGGPGVARLPSPRPLLRRRGDARLRSAGAPGL